jgi:VWFA-related protein
MKAAVGVLASLVVVWIFAPAHILAGESRFGQLQFAQLQKVETQGSTEAERARTTIEQGKPPSSASPAPPPGAPSSPAPGGTSPPGAQTGNLYARINQIAVSPVEWPTITLYVSVSDLQGRPAQGIQSGDFMVDEQGTLGKPASVKTFAESEGGMAIVLVLDASGSMKGQPFREAKRAVNSFLSLLGPKDRVALMVLEDEVRLAAPFTSNMRDVKAKVDETEATAKITLLYDGLAKAVDEINARGTTLPTRRAIVVLSDGRDEGSTKKLEDVRDHALEANVPVYSVGFTRVGPQYLPNLRRISDLTGGLYVDAHAPSQLSEIYAQVFEHVRSLYVVGFRATTIKPDGQSHMLRVRVTSQGTQTDTPPRSFIAPLIEVATPRRNWVTGALVALAVLAALALVIGWWAARRSRPGICATCGRALAPDSVECAFCNAAAANPTFGRLVVQNGTGRGVEYELAEADNTIGISKENRVVLKGDGIAEQHAKISVSGKRYELTDSGSETGTYVNGKRVRQRYLKDKDVVKIGDVELIFEMVSR